MSALRRILNNQLIVVNESMVMVTSELKKMAEEEPELVGQMVDLAQATMEARAFLKYIEEGRGVIIMDTERKIN
jgi:uncharacterized glyoxalase superfamily protein PhnB